MVRWRTQRQGRTHLLAAVGSLLLLTGAEATPAKDPAYMTLKFDPPILGPGQTAGLIVNGVAIGGITHVRATPRREGGGWIELTRPASKEGFHQWIVRSRFGRLGSDAIRTNGSIIVYDTQASEVKRWSFTDGWPSKTTSARQGQVAMETLIISAEGLEPH